MIEEIKARMEDAWVLATARHDLQRPPYIHELQPWWVLSIVYKAMSDVRAANAALRAKKKDGSAALGFPEVKGCEAQQVKLDTLRVACSGALGALLQVRPRRGLPLRGREAA